MKEEKDSVCLWCGNDPEYCTCDYDTEEGLTCQVCGGDGFVQEDEYECDWINCGPNVICCPECGGHGFYQTPKGTREEYERLEAKRKAETASNKDWRV